jgi:CRP/FNR family transcriptional regulator, cyclic AMP receptor protein
MLLLRAISRSLGLSKPGGVNDISNFAIAGVTIFFAGSRLSVGTLSASTRVPTQMKLFSQDMKVESLKRAPLFAGLSRKELVQLARLSDDVEVPAGRVLCKEGDRGREFFILVEGEVDVASKGRRLATLGAGDFVGEISLLEPTPRTATVTAKTPVRFFVLTPKDFNQMLEENPSVERKVLRALARRLLELSRDPTLA